MTTIKFADQDIIRKVTAEHRLPFTPYHFARFLYGHTPYTWYFCVPILFYYGYRIFEGEKIFDVSAKSALHAVFLAFVLSSFGVYFAFYGVLLLMLCALAGVIKSYKIMPAVQAAVLCALITIGVICNLAPSILYRWLHGVNAEAVLRHAIETEVYSLKIIHLLLPPPWHRISELGHFTANYDATFPLSNTVSSLGLIGNIGFLALLVAGIAIVVGRVVDPRVRFAVLTVLFTLLVCTVGGLNDLIALFITQLIRGWDRFAVFVAFGVALTTAVTLERYSSFRKFSPMVASCIAAAIVIVGMLDQTPATLRPVINGAFSRYDTDATFVARIDDALPPGAAIYQLPYIPFLESAGAGNIGPYDLLGGFMTSTDLRWSFGGMKGREGDLFFREMATKSPAQQISMARELGFSGIYIDKRGYADGGAAIVEDFSAVIGQPALTRSDGNVVFFRLD